MLSCCCMCRSCQPALCGLLGEVLVESERESGGSGDVRVCQRMHAGEERKDEGQPHRAVTNDDGGV